MGIKKHVKNNRNMATLILAILCSFALLSCGCERHQTINTCFPVTEQEESRQQQQISFLYFSDTQADPETGDYSGFGEMLVLAITQEVNPDVIVFGGDTINDGGDLDEWQKFREATAIPLSGLLTATVPGNHDNYSMLAEQFDYPVKAPVIQGEGFLYSFEKGLVFFIMLDSNIMGAANDRDIEWLRNELRSEAARQAAWRIAVMHHPMWTVTLNPNDNARAETMREYFLPLLEEYGVDLILCGHQHVYTRSLPMNNHTAAQDGKGIVQFMAASGGKKSYKVENMDYISVSANAPNFLHITANGEMITILAYDENGDQFDAYTITR